MDASELAKLMLDWQDLKIKLDDMEAKIKTAVLELGKTQTVGNVRASYSKGRGRYDYQAACYAAGYTDDKLGQWQTLVINTDYKTASSDLSLDVEPYYIPASGGPTVSVKLLV